MFLNSLALDVLKAWKNNEFDIFLQPSINANDMSIEGFEALIRWNHPVHGVLEPNHFFPVLKSMNMFEQLDFFVFEKVCAFLGKRRRWGKPLFCISCNFSREHFEMNTFIQKLEVIREKYDIPSQYLAVEILEGSMFFNEPQVQKNVQELNCRGYQIYLDDCGADNSIVSDLMFHSITHLKIDKKMTRNIEQEHVQVVIQGLCNIAHKLSYRVVCEGVETQRQLELVRECGVDAVQGFYFYQPMDTICAEVLYDTVN